MPARSFSNILSVIGLILLSAACREKGDDSGSGDAGLTPGELSRWIPDAPSGADDTIFYHIWYFRDESLVQTGIVTITMFDLKVPDCWPCDSREEGFSAVNLNRRSYAAYCKWDGAPEDALEVTYTSSDDFDVRPPTAWWSPGLKGEPATVVITQPTDQPDGGGTDPTYHCELARGAMRCQGEQEFRAAELGTEPELSCEILKDFYSD